MQMALATTPQLEQALDLARQLALVPQPAEPLDPDQYKAGVVKAILTRDADRLLQLQRQYLRSALVDAFIAYASVIECLVHNQSDGTIKTVSLFATEKLDYASEVCYSRFDWSERWWEGRRPARQEALLELQLLDDKKEGVDPAYELLGRVVVPAFSVLAMHLRKSLNGSEPLPLPEVEDIESSLRRATAASVLLWQFSHTPGQLLAMSRGAAAFYKYQLKRKNQNHDPAPPYASPPPSGVTAPPGV